MTSIFFNLKMNHLSLSIMNIGLELAEGGRPFRGHGYPKTSRMWIGIFWLQYYPIWCKNYTCKCVDGLLSKFCHGVENHHHCINVTQMSVLIFWGRNGNTIWNNFTPLYFSEFECIGQNHLVLILYFMVLLAAIMTPNSVKFIFGTPKVIRVI